MGQARRQVPECLPAKLLQIRTLLGLTQVQMADLLNHLNAPPQPGMISRFETGQREPTLLILLEYARIAGMPMESLVDDSVHLPDKLPAKTGSKKGRWK